jgi:hypothetical protein
VKLFLISNSFHSYFSWNFWSPGGPPFDRINSNSFEIHLNISQSPQFIWARPASRFSPGRPTCACALLLSPSPVDSGSPRVSAPPRYPALSHPAADVGPRFPFRPTCQPRRSRRPDPEPFPGRAWAPSFSPVLPTMRRPPLDPLPLIFRSVASPRALSKVTGRRPRPPSSPFSSPAAPRAAAS